MNKLWAIFPTFASLKRVHFFLRWITRCCDDEDEDDDDDEDKDDAATMVQYRKNCSVASGVSVSEDFSLKKPTLAKKQFLAAPLARLLVKSIERTTAREHFCRPAVSDMIKNEVGRYKKINTFHYRNPGNGAERFSRRLHYEGVETPCRVSRLYFHQRTSGSIKPARGVERKRKYIASIRAISRETENGSCKYSSGLLRISSYSNLSAAVERIDRTRG